MYAARNCDRDNISNIEETAHDNEGVLLELTGKSLQDICKVIASVKLHPFERSYKDREFSSDRVARAHDCTRGRRTCQVDIVHPRFTKPDVSHFVGKREDSRGLRVSSVDDDQWSKIIR